MSLQTKTEMAIFGMNGLYAAALYFVGLFALYGTRDAGFKTKTEMEDWWRIKARKAAARASGDPSQVKQAYRAERAKQAQGFKEPVAGFQQKEWVR